MNNKGTEKRIYLDYNATTPIANEVIESITSAMNTSWGNPSSNYDAGISAKQWIDRSRKNVAECIGAEPDDIVFTSGGSESNNWVLRSVVDQYNHDKRRDKCEVNSSDASLEVDRAHVITTRVEHPSITEPLADMLSRGDVDVSWLSIDESSGEIDLTLLKHLITHRTCLITVMMANNETGTIMPIKEIVRIAREQESQSGRRLLVHSDAAQAIGKIAVDVSDLDVDFLTIAGHKLYGPRIGALFAKDLHAMTSSFKPLILGGGQERGWRAGTENTPMIAGLGTACRLVRDGLPRFAANMKSTRDYLEDKLVEVFGKDRVHFNCRSSQRLPNTCNVSILHSGCEGYKIVRMATRLSCSTGAACHADKCQPSPILTRFGVSERHAMHAVRLSTGRDTSLSDIDAAVAELQRIVASSN